MCRTNLKLFVTSATFIFMIFLISISPPDEYEGEVESGGQGDVGVVKCARLREERNLFVPIISHLSTSSLSSDAFIRQLPFRAALKLLLVRERGNGSHSTWEVSPETEEKKKRREEEREICKEIGSDSVVHAVDSFSFQ
jgi:hypothetical protein